LLSPGPGIRGATLADSIISASGLTKRFGPSAGVFDIDLDIASGLIVGFIGPSGSGKTTTIRLMTGILAPDSGRVVVLGADPTAFDTRTRGRIGYMPQESILYPHLTLRDNLNFAASLYGMPYRRSTQIERMIDFVALGDAVDRLPGQASGGEQRRLMLASTLIHQPDLIFLDEPTAGIDPVLRRKFWDRFEELGEQGRTLVVTTQYVGEAAYCDYVAVLAGGRILSFDTPEGLRRAAFDGELIDLTFENPPASADLASLDGALTRHPVQWIDSRRVRVVVEDAGAAAPQLTKWAEQRGLTLEKAESYLPPFDDVFVHLVDSLEETRDEEAERVG
jgi:ABC-2 type transport system ATP-binding protein